MGLDLAWLPRQHRLKERGGSHCAGERQRHHPSCLRKDGWPIPHSFRSRCRALKRVVMTNSECESHRNDAKPREEQQTVSIAAGMISEPTHCEGAGESREIAD
ncbi:hypothetical protein ABIB05_003061 [Bradyrhizobium sp. LB5.2]